MSPLYAVRSPLYAVRTPSIFTLLSLFNILVLRPHSPTLSLALSLLHFYELVLQLSNNIAEPPTAQPSKRHNRTAVQHNHPASTGLLRLLISKSRAFKGGSVDHL